MTNHGAGQLLWRDRWRGVSTEAIADAVNNLLRVVGRAGGRTLYKGAAANVVLNRYGILITAYARAQRGQRWRFGR